MEQFLYAYKIKKEPPISNQITLSILKDFPSKYEENSESQNYCVFF